VSLGSDSLSSLFRTPVVECFITPNDVWMIVKVPVVPLESDWKIFIHPHFAHKEKTYHQNQPEPAYFAKDGQRAVLLKGEMFQHCDISNTGLCYVPFQDKDSPQST